MGVRVFLLGFFKVCGIPWQLCSFLRNACSRILIATPSPPLLLGAPITSTNHAHHCPIPSSSPADFKSPGEVMDFDVLAEAFAQGGAGAGGEDGSAGPWAHDPLLGERR